MVVPFKVTVASETLAIPGWCIDVNRGGRFQLFIKHCAHAGGGVRERANGIEYSADPRMPSFAGSVTSSTMIRMIFMSSNVASFGADGDSIFLLADESMVASGLPMGGAAWRIPNKVRTRSS